MTESSDARRHRLRAQVMTWRRQLAGASESHVIMTEVERELLALVDENDHLRERVPETEHERRARLVREQLDKARAAGILGLTTNDATVTVNAILEALDGEFIEDCELDHEPEL